MEYLVVGVVFGPVLLLFISLLLQGKGLQVFVEVWAVLFFIGCVLLFIYPLYSVSFHAPSILWKLTLLIVVIVLLIYSIRDKHYVVSALALVQALSLIIMEITASPAEVEPFLWFQHDGKLLLLTGAFIIMASIPLILRYLKKYFRQIQSDAGRMKQSAKGLFLLMASFAGLVAANSITGLLLFWQLSYLANRFFHKSFEQHESNRIPLIPVIQQLALTIWMIVILITVQKTGSLAIGNINTGLGSLTASMTAVLVFIMVIVTGCLIPEKQIIKTYFSKPTPVTGLTSIIFSLIIPISVLLKFRMLFAGIDRVLLSLVIVFGGLLMAAVAYYAGIFRRSGNILVCMVLFASGWGISNIFNGMESLFFTAGFAAVTAVTLSFLFSCITVLEYLKGTQDVERMYNLLKEMPIITFLMSAAMLLFLFAPFYAALQRMVFVRFLITNPITMILAVIGLVLTAAVLFRWLSVFLAAGRKTSIERQPYPVIFKIILPVFFVVTVVLNILSGNLYDYFQYQQLPVSLLPAANFETYTGMEGLVKLTVPGTGSIYLAGSLLILAVVFVVTRRLNREQAEATPEAQRVFYHYTLTSWIPKSINFDLWIRTGWLTVVILLVGVALS